MHSVVYSLLLCTLLCIVLHPVAHCYMLCGALFVHFFYALLCNFRIVRGLGAAVDEFLRSQFDFMR